MNLIHERKFMQTIPTYICQLLDKTKNVTGSDYRTAQSLGVARSVVSNWRTGQTNCSPEDVAQLAAIAGLEADKWLIRAVLAKHEGTAKGDRLMKALGKVLAVTGGAVTTNGAAAQSIFSIEQINNFIRCILC